MLPILSALSSRRTASLIRGAGQRVIYAAPGIQIETAKAIAERAGELMPIPLTVALDFDERTLRMGYGALEAVDLLRRAGVEPTHCPGLRCGILVVDGSGWVFTPTARYLEAEPQSDETPNAVALSPAQVQELALRLSPAVQQQATAQAATQEEAEAIAALQCELGMQPIANDHFSSVKQAIETAPPVKFDVVRQVRVFEPYLQYVELSLTGASIERKRVQIPKSLQNLGAARDLEGKLKTTFDLIEKGSSLSSKGLEDELNEIRRNFTPSLGKDHGRVVLKAAKPKLLERLAELRKKLGEHQTKVQNELQTKLNESKTQVVQYYLPRARINPPDALVGALLKVTDADVEQWIEEELTEVFPSAESLIRKMTLEDNYKDVTFETLNRPDFLDSVKAAFPRIDWEKPFHDFKAAAESEKSRRY